MYLNGSVAGVSNKIAIIKMRKKVLVFIL